MKRIVFISCIAFFSFIALVSCGGEDCAGDECNEPVDDNITTDTEPTDDSEVTDDATDEVETDDVQTDDPEIDEKPDEDITPPSCEEDPTCQEDCQDNLAKEGNWKVKIPTTVTGTITIKLSSVNGECNVAVSGMWTFVWKGNYQCLEVPEYFSFFSLLDMEEDQLAIQKSSSQESCENGGGAFYKFEKIQ
jgi:hypothetical protein